MAGHRILLVEDNPSYARIVTKVLTDHDMHVVHAVDFASGMAAALNQEWDCMLLDICLPGGRGTAICEAVKQKEIRTPVCMLTDLSAEIPKLESYDAGADDHISKTETVEVLVRKIQAWIRRSRTGNASALAPTYRIQYEPSTGTVWRDGKEVKLKPKVNALMRYLLEHPGVHPRLHLYTNLWDKTVVGDSEKVVDVTLCRLRILVEQNPRQPRIVLNRRGYGFTLNREAVDVV